MTGSKPWPRSFVQRPAHERELEQHEVAAQVGEARARQPRAALHVDPLAGQLEVVAAGRAPASPTSRSDRVLVGARSGRAGSGSVASAACSSLLDAARSSSSSALTCADDVLHRARSPRRRPRRAAWRRRSPPRPAFCSARSASSRGSSSRQRASSASTLVDARRDVGAAARQRGADRVGVAADQPEVEHGAGQSAGAVGCRGAAGVLAPACPSTWRGTSATVLGLLPDHDVLGHDRAGEAAVADRVEDAVGLLLARVEVRAVDALAVADLRSRSPARRPTSSVWQPEQRSAKSCAPS